VAFVSGLATANHQQQWKKNLKTETPFKTIQDKSKMGREQAKQNLPIRTNGDDDV
jgi:hypothetical protein